MAGISTNTNGSTLDSPETAEETFEVNWGAAPIDRLAPGSQHHQYVLDYLLRRIESSEREMSNFYARWRTQERKCQAYMHLPQYEQILKDMNDAGKPPQPAIITIPYMFATISTITTYLGRVFCGRKPIMQIGATKGSSVDKVRKMETVLQYNADYVKLVMRLFQFFLDGEVYGLAVMRNTWRQDWGTRTKWVQPAAAGLMLGQTKPQRESEDRIVFEGNDVDNIDPYMFFPDPNVPMAEVNTKGEFVAWRQYMGRHALLTQERLGTIKYVRDLKPEDCTFDTKWFDHSNRNIKAGGRGNAAQTTITATSLYQVDQGSFEIIPAELGLGESYYPEKWLFTIVGKKQIIQAVPLQMDHGKHPVVVCEPYTTGYGFGQPGVSDYLGPLQDLMSWMIDTHIYNVRAALHNMFIVDPSKVEMQDLRTPGPTKIIRLKPNSMGTDVRAAVQQLQVTDVTQAHLNNIPMLIKVGDSIAAVNDGLRGQQTTSGDTTATEARITGESALSRLGKHGQTYSVQGIVDLAQQQVMNIQQKMDQDLWLEIVGDLSGADPQQITPADLSGDFNFPVYDGTLPLDKVALQQTWLNGLQTMMSDQELRQNFSVPKTYEYLMELAGAQNIQQFRLDQQPTLRTPGGAMPIQPNGAQVAPTAQVMAQADAGNMMPVGSA